MFIGLKTKNIQLLFRFPQEHDRFHVTSNEIGIFKSGKFVSRSDFSIKLNYFVEAGVEYVAEITSTHLSEKTK